MDFCFVQYDVSVSGTFNSCAEWGQACMLPLTDSAGLSDGQRGQRRDLGHRGLRVRKREQQREPAEAVLTGWLRMSLQESSS